MRVFIAYIGEGGARKVLVEVRFQSGDPLLKAVAGDNCSWLVLQAGAGRRMIPMKQGSFDMVYGIGYVSREGGS